MPTRRTNIKVALQRLSVVPGWRAPLLDRQGAMAAIELCRDQGVLIIGVCCFRVLGNGIQPIIEYDLDVPDDMISPSDTCDLVRVHIDSVDERKLLIELYIDV